MNKLLNIYPFTNFFNKNKMFSLIKGFYEYIFSKPIHRVLMIGLDGSGKTTLLEKIKALAG